VTGDRFASILDPFGQRWTVMTRVEDVSPEERDRRMAEWAKKTLGVEPLTWRNVLCVLRHRRR
jgi:PhnB protein